MITVGASSCLCGLPVFYSKMADERQLEEYLNSAIEIAKKAGEVI